MGIDTIAAAELGKSVLPERKKGRGVIKSEPKFHPPRVRSRYPWGKGVVKTQEPFSFKNRRFRYEDQINQAGRTTVGVVKATGELFMVMRFLCR